MELSRITNILGAGTYAAHFAPKLWVPCQELGATRTLLSMGRLELNRATASEPTHFGRGGVLDVSPPPKLLQNAIGNAGSDEIAETNRDCWQHLAHGMIDQVVQAYEAVRLVDGQTLWLQGFKTGHGKPAEESLRELKQRLPRMFVVAASVLPDNADKRAKLREGGHDLFIRLKDESVVESTLLTDNLSPFARSFTLDTQDQFKARALASLLASQVQFTRNPSLGEIGRSLGDYAALVGMAFASRSVAVQGEAAGWRLLRGLLPGLPARGTAGVDHLVQEARLATEQALKDPQALAIAEHIDPSKPCFVVYTVPLRRTEAQAWVRFSNHVRTWLANTHPAAIPVFVSGAGCRDPRYSGAYWLQVSVLFPLPDVPAPLAAILGSSSQKRRRGPNRTHTPSNGQVHPPTPVKAAG